MAKTSMSVSCTRSTPVVKLLKSRWWNSKFPPLPSLSLPSFSLLLEVGPLNPARGSGGALKALPARSGAKPQSKYNFVYSSLKSYLWLAANDCNDFSENQLIKKYYGDGTASAGGVTATLGGVTAISGGGTPDTGCGTPFRTSGCFTLRSSHLRYHTDVIRRCHIYVIHIERGVSCIIY